MTKRTGRTLLVATACALLLFFVFSERSVDEIATDIAAAFQTTEQSSTSDEASRTNPPAEPVVAEKPAAPTGDGVTEISNATQSKTSRGMDLVSDGETQEPAVEQPATEHAATSDPASGDGYQTATDTDSERPRFPWPPPQASTVVRLPLDRLLDLTTGRTHGAIADLLEDTLDQGEYFDRSYWVAPGGFALATRLERITEDGAPVGSQNRWPTTNLTERFELSRYLKSLFFTDPGYFRVIVFLLSSEFERTSDAEPTPDEAFRWLRRGMVMLPPDMARLEITPNHELTALIYEFERVPGSDAVVLAPGRLTGRTHLARARLQSLLAE